MAEPEDGHLDIEAVLKIAHLARIGLTREQAAAFSGQISSILVHFTQLAEANVPPGTNTVGALGPEDLLRADEVRPGLTRDEFLAIVPRTRDGFVVVPAVMQQSEH
jgi:aspartyl-tRNA(Asn)/glutamyl-tRNA(Gln) amidotransferase subunit C